MPTRGRKTNLFIAIIISTLLLLAACGNTRAPRRTMQTAAAVAVPPRRTLSPLPVRQLPARLEAVRERALQEASAVRGLAWKSGVGMTELSGWEYGTRTKEVAEALGGDDLKALSTLAVAGGILPAGTDLATLAVSFTALTAGATYSPLDKQVLLLQPDKSAQSDKRNASADASKDRSLLTHEFVHALQDQHFDLLSLVLARPYNFDRTEAAFALVEGDAMNVQRRQESGDAWARRSLEEIARQEDERFGAYRRGVGAFFPPLLTETFIFRYRDGARFVETLRRSRPGFNVDELFRRPPASSEQVLHPEKYLSNETARDVTFDERELTAAGWRLTTSTPLGEIGVRGLLLAGVPAREAARASAGWGGDRAYVFERNGTIAPLFVWQTRWDNREDAQEFFRAYNALRRSRRETEVRDASNIAPRGETATLWRDGDISTLVSLAGDGVVVLRGTETDIRAALPFAQR